MPRPQRQITECAGQPDSIGSPASPHPVNARAPRIDPACYRCLGRPAVSVSRKVNTALWPSCLEGASVKRACAAPLLCIQKTPARRTRLREGAGKVNREPSRKLRPRRSLAIPAGSNWRMSGQAGSMAFDVQAFVSLDSRLRGNDGAWSDFHQRGGTRESTLGFAAAVIAPACRPHAGAQGHEVKLEARFQQSILDLGTRT